MGHTETLCGFIGKPGAKSPRQVEFPKSLHERTLHECDFDGFEHERSCYSKAPRSGAASLGGLPAVLCLEVAGLAVGLPEEVGQTLQG